MQGVAHVKTFPQVNRYCEVHHPPNVYGQGYPTMKPVYAASIATVFKWWDTDRKYEPRECSFLRYQLKYIPTKRRPFVVIDRQITSRVLRFRARPTYQDLIEVL